MGRRLGRARSINVCTCFLRVKRAHVRRKTFVLLITVIIIIIFFFFVFSFFSPNFVSSRALDRSTSTTPSALKSALQCRFVEKFSRDSPCHVAMLQIWSRNSERSPKTRILRPATRPSWSAIHPKVIRNRRWRGTKTANPCRPTRKNGECIFFF